MPEKRHFHHPDLRALREKARQEALFRERRKEFTILLIIVAGATALMVKACGPLIQSWFGQ